MHVYDYVHHISITGRTKNDPYSCAVLCENILISKKMSAHISQYPPDRRNILIITLIYVSEPYNYVYRIAGNFQRDKFSEISNITEIHSKS